jgi:serine O-acetyltransferase
MELLKAVLRCLRTARTLPALLMVRRAVDKTKIYRDIDRWVTVLSLPPAADPLHYLPMLLTESPAFRNLLELRLRGEQTLLRKLTFTLLLRPVDTLKFYVDEVGGGLFIQYGYASVISADKIGEDCWIGQQVTLGYVYHRGRPTLGDRVTIGAGAIVVGPVTIGDDSTVGAGTTVVSDVPPHTVVVGPPARFLNRPGLVGGNIDPRVNPPAPVTQAEIDDGVKPGVDGGG